MTTNKEIMEQIKKCLVWRENKILEQAILSALEQKDKEWEEKIEKATHETSDNEKIHQGKYSIIYT